MRAWSLLFAVAAVSSASASPLRAVVPAASPAPPSSDCEACLFVVGVAADIGHANASTLKELLVSLDAICAAVAGNLSSICDLIAEIVVDDALPFLDVQLDTLAWPIPQGVCSLFVPVCFNPCCEADYAPEQVRLAFTGNASEMRVAWVTLTDGGGAAGGAGVTWGPSGGPLTNSAPIETLRNYTYGDWIGYISTATMTGLAPGAAYDYQVGGKAGLSRVFSFKTLASDAGSVATPLRFIQIGDMGYGNHSDVTVATMAAMVAAGEVDFILHVREPSTLWPTVGLFLWFCCCHFHAVMIPRAPKHLPILFPSANSTSCPPPPLSPACLHSRLQIGDVSYADGYMPHWDAFGRKVENISSSVPYMVGPGNRASQDL